MIKIGIFVEGQTERIFVVEFLKEYLGGEHKFSRLEIKLKNKNTTTFITERKFSQSRFYFLIFDTSGDGNVLPALYERSENMIKKNNFHFLLALQDLYPKPRNSKSKILNNFLKSIDRFDFKEKLRFILAIMEIEAWFLADYNLFKKLYNIISFEYIYEKLNIDLKNNNSEFYQHPAEIINRIFKLFNEKYRKSEKQIRKIVSNLDFDLLCSDETLKKIKSFKYFIHCIDEALNE